MSFKLISPFKKHATPIVNVPMEENVMGRADKRGNILVNKDLKDPKQIEDTINHEQVHIEQMASGELDYDEKNVYDGFCDANGCIYVCSNYDCNHLRESY